MRSRTLSLGLALLAACKGESVTTPPEVVIPDRLTTSGLGGVEARFTAEVWVHGNFAYTTTWGRRGPALLAGNTVFVWDVSGVVPQLVDSVLVDSTATSLGDVQVSEDGALLVVPTEFGPGTIVIYGLSNPTRPQLIARFVSPSITQGVHTCTLARVSGKLYAFLAVNRGGGEPSKLMIVDLSKPSQPAEVMTRAMGSPFIHDVFVRDGLLFTALWNDGLTIWDLGGAGRGGTVANPVELGNVRTINGKVHNVWWYHDPATGDKRFAFVGEEGPAAMGNFSSGDVHVVDVSDLTAPREVATLTVAGAGPHNFFVDETQGLLYAAYYNAGIQVIDARGNIGDCAAEARRSDGRCDLALAGRVLSKGLLEEGLPVFVWGVHVSGDHVYASDMLNGLWKVGAIRR